MIRRPRYRQYHSMADINIANLVDVCLVLLIIFMISAPLLQSGIEVELPKTVAKPITEESSGVVVTIDKKGGIYINDVFHRFDQFGVALDKEMKAKGTTSVYLRGDSAIAYGTAISVIGKMKEMGIESIGLVTGHDDKKAAGARKK